MQIFRSAAVVAATLALATPVFAADEMKPDAKSVESFTFAPQNASGETGTVTLAPTADGATTVTVTLKGGPADAQPAHIHPGTCAKLDPKPLYPLTNIVGGTSTTVVKTSIDKLTAGGFAVNVHKSTSDIATYVACANLADKDDASMKKMK